MSEPLTMASPVAQANPDDQVRTLAATLAQVQGTSATLVKCVVTATALTGTPPSITVQIGGDTSTSVAGVRFIDSYSPVVTDTCLAVKQGSDLFALGQINDSNEGNSANGWVTPTLGSSFSHNGAGMGNLQYRVVVDNGDRKLQFKGGVNVVNSSSANLFTLPAGAVPVANRNTIVNRNFDGGSNVAGLQVNTGGVVSLQGPTAVPTSTSTPTGTDSAPNHNHTNPEGGNVGLGGSHYHDVNAHSHANTVAYPTWLSLNGVEVFL